MPPNKDKNTSKQDNIGSDVIGFLVTLFLVILVTWFAMKGCEAYYWQS